MIGIIGTKRQDNKSSFEALIKYCCKDGRAAYVGMQNIHFPVSAAEEMASLALQNPRCKDPLMHIILSWREMELPTKTQIDEAAKIALNELDLQDCQAVWIVHSDTENLHVHIAANRIDPETHKTIQPAGRWTHKAIQRATRKIELAQGWSIEPHGIYMLSEDGNLIEKQEICPERTKLSKQAADSEVHTAIKSAERIAQETAAPIIRETKNWQELHKHLAEVGIMFDKKGSGAILWVGDTAVKASTAGRDISMSKLCERLGVYEPRSEEIIVADRQPEPIEKVEKVKVKPDWERYQVARNQYYKDKSDAYATMRERHKKERAELRDIQKAERERVFSGSWKGCGALLNRQRSIMAAHQQGEKLNLADIQKKEIEMFRQTFPKRFKNFKRWLEEGCEQASILNYRYPDQGAIFGASDASNLHVPPSYNDLRLFKPTHGSKGGVAYVAEGSQQAAFIDYGKRIILAERSGDAEILAALQLANQKWGSADIQGSEEYKQKCVEIAASHNLRISNPDLSKQVEEKRNEQMKKRKIRQKKTSKESKEIAESHTDLPKISSDANRAKSAYWSHYRDIVSKLQGDIDYSRIDAMIGIRMRVTGYSQSDVRSAIKNNAPAMRRETMNTEAFEAKYSNRDWKRYAAETTDNYIFGARGAIQHEKALQYKPLYMRIEGGSIVQEQEARKKKNRGR